MILFELCENSNFLTMLLILKYLMHIIGVLIPIIFAFNVIRGMFSTVVKPDEFKSILTRIFKSLIAGLVVFFIPSIMSFIFITFINHDFKLCENNLSIDKIDYYRELEKKERLEKSLNDRKKKDEAYQERLEEDRKKNEEINKRREEMNKGNEHNIHGTVTIHIGDSRTVGMCIAVTNDSSGCQLSSGGPKYYDNDIFIAQGSMGYDWFSTSAVSAVNSIINSNPDTIYNIVSYMGVNFLLSDIDEYINLYNALNNDSWSKHNFIVVSVNPVDESKERQYGYSTTNNDIVTFNSKLKNGINSNIKYCDVYNSILNNFDTSDGLHYKSDTYLNIYDLVNSCL